MRATVPIEGIEFAKHQLLRLGAEVKIVGPLALRAAVLDEAKKVAAYYRR